MSKKHRSNSGGGSIANKRSMTPKFRLMPSIRMLVKKAPELTKEFVNSWSLVNLMIVVEVVINYLIIKHVKYTEIDWSTYMAQARQIFNSSNFNFNYTQIEGPTGPLVYPAGHAYIFYLLKELTNDGSIQMGQYIYLCIYIAQLKLVCEIYSHKRTSKVPPYVLLIQWLTSYRVHSIYVLRLFNDPIAVLLAYASFLALLRRRHLMSAILFSLAISVKMNILLYAPSYALIFYEEVGSKKSLKYALVALITQLLLAAPFLIVNPLGYLSRAFDFGRVFLYQWTVNWRFLDEQTFTSPAFFKLMIIIHLALLFIVFWPRWLRIITFDKVRLYVRRTDLILTLFIGNFIGVACSRSLHYQFYVWYFHSLPLLLWTTRYGTPLKFLLLACIEYSWNVFPSTKLSSGLLHASHVLIILGLIHRMYFWTPSASNANGKISVKKRR